MTALIAPAGRRPVLLAVILGSLVTVVLAVIVWRGASTSVDTWVFEHGGTQFGSATGTRRTWWLCFTEPVVSLVVPIAIAVWAWATRQRTLALFTVVAPLIALGMTELVGKPLVGRQAGPFLRAGAGSHTFPSGHETGLVSWLVVALVVVFRQTDSVRWRAGTLAVAVLWALAGALGLTINHYHYATDTIGAIALTVAVVLAVALAIDRWAGRRVSSPGGRDPARTARGV